MTMNKVEVEELLNVLEMIRNERFPDIPKGLVRGIVSAQFEKQDDRTQARRDTKKLIDDFLKESIADDL